MGVPFIFSSVEVLVVVPPEGFTVIPSTILIISLSIPLSFSMATVLSFA